MNNETNLINTLEEVERQVMLAQESIGGEISPFEVYLAPKITPNSAISFAVIADILPSNGKAYYIWGWLKALGLPAFVVSPNYYTRPQRVEMAIATEQIRNQAKK